MIIFIAWVLFILYWLYSAQSSQPVANTHHGKIYCYLLPLMICDALLISPITTITLWDFPIIGTSLVIIGMFIAIWSRDRLGHNWSGLLTLQQDHQLVTDGPYKYVRHPIYAGILLAFIGTGLYIGDLRGYIAPAFALLAFSYKARIEEQQLTQRFPEYHDYKQRTIW